MDAGLKAAMMANMFGAIMIGNPIALIAGAATVKVRQSKSQKE